MATDKDILKDAQELFAICDEEESENRERWLDDLRFGRLGDQWPEEVKRQRDLDRRPCLTINTNPAFIRQVVNDARQNKPSIKVLPFDDFADVETAKILSGQVRHIEYNSRADIAYDTAIDNSASMGIGYIRVDLDYTCNDSFDMDIKINSVTNPFTVYADPYSTSADGSDWNVAFVSELKTEKMFKKLYPNAEMVDFQGQDLNKETQLWKQQDMVRVAEYWARDKVKKNIMLLSDGKVVTEDMLEKNSEALFIGGTTIERTREAEFYEVKQYLITGAEVLEKNEWPGMYIPIIPVYGEEVNENGKRHIFSLIHHAKDAQRNKNYWRTAATELVALAPKAPWVGPKGAFRSDPNWSTANTANHPYLEFDGQIAPRREPFAGVPPGALQEALNATDDVKAILGLYDASLGAKSNETSGRAIMARQREGDNSTFHFIDNLTRSIRQVGAVVLDLIPHVYNSARMIRILGEDDTPSAVPINQQVMVDNNGIRKATPEEIEQKLSRVFDFTVGKYDVAVKAGASYTTRREEAATQMMELMRTMPETASVISDLLAKNLDWPGADEIAERLKSLNPYIKQKQIESNPMLQAKQQQQEMLQTQMAQAELATRTAEAELKKAEAFLKVKEANTPIDNTEAQQRYAIEMEKIKADYALRMREIEVDLQAQREKLQSEQEIAAMQERSKIEMHEGSCSPTHNEGQSNEVISRMDEVLSQIEYLKKQIQPKKISIQRDANDKMISATMEATNLQE